MGSDVRLEKVRNQAVDALKVATPPTVRREIVQRRLQARRISARWRALPDFLIIGCQRGGTSSLYKYLGRHPQIVPALRKETEYFTINYPKGESWYRAHFALRMRLGLGRLSGTRRFTFEATPDYLLDPRAPERVADLLPEALLIVLLREPRERAWSHYRHNVRLGIETETFEDAVRLETERISKDLERLHDWPGHPFKAFRRFSYTKRGMYAEQVQRWLEAFPRDQFLFLESEGFFADPKSVLQEILQFIGAEQWAPLEFRNYSYYSNNAVVRRTLPPNVRDLLDDRFASSNEALRSMIPGVFTWLED